MPSWSELHQDFQHLSNLTIVCLDGRIKSHKIIVANISRCIKNILKEIPTIDEATIFLQDYSKNDIQHFLRDASTNKSNLHPELSSLFGIEILLPELIPKIEMKEGTFSPKTVKNEASSDNEETDLNVNESCEDVEEKHDLVIEESTKPKLSRAEKAATRKSRYLDKKIRFEKAIAALKSGEAPSGCKAASIYGVPRASLNRYLRENTTVKRMGKKLTYLSHEEEEAIADRILLLSNGGEEISLSRMKEIFWTEIKSLIFLHPEREEVLLKLDPQAPQDPNFFHNFAVRNNLKKVTKKFSIKCQRCHMSFSSHLLFLQHQRKVHKKDFEKEMEEDKPFDEDQEPMSESSDQNKNLDFYEFDQQLELKVKELEEDKYENPTTEKERSINEKIDKKIRCERALAALVSGRASSARKAARMFGVPQSSINRYRRQGMEVPNEGAQRKYLSKDEEKHIAKRVRSLATGGTIIDMALVKKVFHEEVEILKINFPERETTLNKMGRDMAKQFAMRHGLCKESDQQRRKYLEEKRTFECEVCHQLYSDKKYILRHMRAVHSFLL